MRGFGSHAYNALKKGDAAYRNRSLRAVNNPAVNIAVSNREVSMVAGNTACRIAAAEVKDRAVIDSVWASTVGNTILDNAVMGFDGAEIGVEGVENDNEVLDVGLG